MLIICLYVYTIIFFYILEEIEKREKTLIEELNLIEVQIGLGKHSQNFDGSTPLNTVAPPRSLEEGEENRDPNPEHSIEVTIDNNTAVSTMQSIISETFDENHDMEKKDEVQLDQVQQDENNG